MSTVLVTGANGFVGKAVCQLLAERGHQVRAAVRRARADEATQGVDDWFAVGDMTADTTWQPALSGADAVIHLAARVHVMRDTVADPLQEFRRVNVAGTFNLARQAAAQKVRRFLFVSSVKVNGEEGTYRETDTPAPQGPYSVSKHEAEIGLRTIAAETGMAVTIIRPPLIYGPGVRANFRTLMQAIASGFPLPFGAIQNRRSLVSLYNLADFIVTTIEHPKAVDQTFLVSDHEDLSTPDLIRRLAAVMQRPARLLPLPPRLLLMMATLVGKQAAAQRLLGSLRVDTSKARNLLGWAPPLTVDEGLKRAAAAYMDSR